MANLSKKDQNILIRYKAFDENFKCRDFQFEVGKEYEAKGKIKACKNGFHACEFPMDIFNYYNVIGTRFAEVEQYGKLDESENDKTASSKIRIKAEINLAKIVKLSIDWVRKKCESGSEENTQAASGDYSQLAASGDYSQLAASGDYSQLAASGYYSKLAASGYYSKLAASGDYSKLAASGDYSQLAASGDSSKLAASGDYSQLAASGDSSKLAASGYYSKLAASGDSSKLAASGDYSQLAASGDYSQLAASGDSSKLAASGYYSQLAASGDSSKLESTGRHSVVAAIGVNNMAKGKKGSWIVLAEYDNNGKPLSVVSKQIDGKEIKEDTWYRLVNGKFEENGKKSNFHFHSIKELLFRVLFFAPICVILFCVYFRHFLYHIWNYIRYGGELCIYDKFVNRKTINDVFVELKTQQDAK